MAILNVTPDSFSDGGRFATDEAAVGAGIRFADLGSALLDVGGESTRPRGAAYGTGATEVSEEEERRRVVPVVEALRRARPGVAISVDTRKTGVAEAALDVGADVVNVVTGLDVPDEMLALVAAREAGLVLNHCRGTPETTFAVSRFENVVADVAADLAAAFDRATAAGVPAERILLDPGLGFGKTAAENVALLAGLDALAPPGVPLVVGASRKAFLGSLSAPIHSASPPPARERLPESLAAVALAREALRASRRPFLVRVHDVEETLRFLAVLDAAATDASAALA